MINLTTRRRYTATLFVLYSLLLYFFSGENSVILAQVVLSHPSVADEPQSDLSGDFDVLTRGPLHEAFASVHQRNPESSPIIELAPPALIDEIPPEYKPDGSNVQWIPGYWAWDETQHDYIWISGVWRDAPPKRRWIPGYWDQATAGYHWVSGYWAEETLQEFGYLPEPPTSIDQGPSTAAPGEDYFYVPGNWLYQDDRYLWATGYWHAVEENWIWIPASYVWTPRGCIYQSGYWDYEFDQRGTCFAPVHFNQPIYQATNYHYQPSYAINLNIDFLTHLFVRPHYNHYYYGDLYSSNFANLGFQPWVYYGNHHRNYDPLLTYYSHRRSTINNRYNTVQYLARQHRFYVNNQNYRPRPTFAAQFNFSNGFKKQSNQRYRDYVSKSSYVRTYSKHRNSSQHSIYRGNERRQNSHYHRIQKDELRSNRREIDQLAKLRRERKQREIRLASSESRRRSVNYRPDRSQRTDNFRNSTNSARRLADEQDRRGRDRERINQLAQTRQRNDRQRREIEQRRQQQASQQTRQRNTEIRNAQRREADADRRDRQRRDEREQRTSELTRERERQQRERRQREAVQTRERSRNERVARNQATQRNRSQQDTAQRVREARRDADRRQQQQRSQQDATARRAREKAQQDSTRRAQEARRDATRRKQQQKSQLDSARRARENAQKDLARRAQKAQSDAARKAKDAARKAKDAARKRKSKAKRQKEK